MIDPRIHSTKQFHLSFLGSLLQETDLCNHICEDSLATDFQLNLTNGRSWKGIRCGSERKKPQFL